MRRFEFTDENSNKYWEISTDGSSFSVRFGRMGASGTTQTKSFSDEATAEAEASKLIREKLRKGYQEVAASPENPTEHGARQNEKSRGGFQELAAFELDIIADFLTQAEADYEDHSCNDYTVPATEQNREVLTAAFQHRSDELDNDGAIAEIIERNSTAEDELFVWDTTLMGYLAHRARSAQADVAEGGAIAAGKRLSEAERDVTAGMLENLAENDFELYESGEGCEDFTLDATPANKAYLAAVVENAKREGWREARRNIMASQDVVSVFAVDILRWLALRCRGRTRVPAAAADMQHPSVIGEQKAADNPPHLGVSKRWMSEKTIVKRATEMDDSWVPVCQKNDLDMVTYANGGNPFRELRDPDVPCSPPFASHVANMLSRAESKYERSAILAFFARDASLNPLEELAREVSYKYWRWQVEAHKAGSADLDMMTQSLAACLSMGYIQEARLQAALLYPSRLEPAHSWREFPQLYRWILSIAFSFWNIGGEQERIAADCVDNRTSECVAKLKEPRLIELFRHWRDPDLTPLKPALHWLCDFYTHELGGDWIAARLPIVILAWFRLREVAGLSNPVIDHPLMKPDYARLIPARSLYTDATLEAMVARLRREELPQLGDLDLQALPKATLWKASPTPEKSEKFASLSIREFRVDNFNLRCLSIPVGWIDRSLPELLRYRDPVMKTELTVSAYRNPGLSYIQWADARLAAFAAAHPWLTRTRDRYEFNGSGWWGWAEEFDGVPPVGGVPLHYLTLCFKNELRLISVTVTATPGVFSENEELYRMLLQGKTYMRDSLAQDDRDHQELWPERQDMPGLKRLVTHNGWMDGEGLLRAGAVNYFGRGNTPEEKQASQDKAYAAELFERAAERGIAAAQYNMALVLSNGEGVPKDLDAAIMWCRKASDQAYEDAVILLEQLKRQRLAADSFSFSKSVKRLFDKW